MSATKLAKFSTAQLLEELARRETRRERGRPIKHWCHDCAHFTPYTGRLDVEIPDDFNPCGKGHRMSFRSPEGYHDLYDHGFYRRVCADRKTSDDADGDLHEPLIEE